MRFLASIGTIAACVGAAGLPVSGDPPDLYQHLQLRPAPPLTPTLNAWESDLWRWVGRQSDYVPIKLEDAANEPRRYAGRLLRAEGDVWRQNGPFASYELFRSPATLPQEVCLDVGIWDLPSASKLGPVWHPRTELNATGQKYGWSGTWYGLVDAYPPARTEVSGYPPAITAVIAAAEPFSSATGVPQRWLDAAVTEIAKDPQGHAEAELSLAEAGGGAAHAERAVALFERDLASPPWLSAELKRQYFALGWTHERFMRDYRRAAQCYRIAHQELGVLPGYQGASYLHHAVCESRLGHRDAARNLLVEFLDRWPFDFSANQAVRMLRSLGYPHDAKRYEYPADHAARTRQALAALKRDDERTALRIFQELSRDCPVDFWSRLEAGYVALSLGEPGTTHNYLEELSRRAPLHAAALRLLSDATNPVGIDAEEYPIRRHGAAITADSHAPALDRLGPYRVQPVLAWIDCRLRRFPDDPLALVLRAQVWAREHLAPTHYSFSGQRDIERAVSLAPASPAVAVGEVSFWSWMADGSQPGSEGEGSAPHRQRLIQALLRSLSKWEAETWGLHAVVAELLGPQSPDGAKHRRRYELLRARRHPTEEKP